jgi:hypothetical protein
VCSSDLASTKRKRMPHSDELEALAQSLKLPADSLAALSDLSAGQLGDLRRAIEAAVEQRRRNLDQALSRILFWPVRGPLLALLRRA